MSRSNCFLAAITAAAVYLWPAAAAGQADAPPPRAVDQLRSAFSDRGFTVDPAYSWDWMLPPVTSFQVRDPSNDRVVLVLVYQSAADAMRAADARPLLVPGYGRSVLSGNVVMVQTTLRELERASRIETDRNNRLHFDQSILPNTSAPTIAVDLDFQEALQSTTANV